MAIRTEESQQRLERILEAKAAGDTEYLIAALKDPDHRPLAARFLAQLSHVEAVPAVMRLLDARDTWSRAAAVKALGTLRAEQAVPRLLELMRDDPASSVRLWAIAALGEIGDNTQRPVLESLLHSPEWDVRRAAAFALDLLGDPRAIESLQHARKRERWGRRYPYRKAIRALRTRHHHRPTR